MCFAPTVPPYLFPLLDLFAASGACAYPVGGCVRDTLLGQIPHDWDVAVTTPPEETEQLCESAGYRVIPTGLKHGTVTVLIPLSGNPSDQKGKYASVECTTCRTEGGYADSRHPDAVAFTGRIEDDLSRRDFTVNAMAFVRENDECFAVLDLFGGQQDLADGIIRCVGDPVTRFSEDALRMLRAVRFATRLAFSIEPSTHKAICDLAPTLGRISRERISVEFQKILCSDDPARGLSLLADTGLLSHILPAGTSEQMPAFTLLPPDFTLRMASLMYGLSPTRVEKNLVGLRLPTVTHKAVQVLAEYRDFSVVPMPIDARRLRHELGQWAAPSVLVRLSHAVDPGERDALTCLVDLICASETAGDPVTLAELSMTGHDLIELGARPGPALRALLEELLLLVLADPAVNTPDRLRKEALARLRFD